MANGEFVTPEILCVMCNDHLNTSILEAVAENSLAQIMKSTRQDARDAGWKVTRKEGWTCPKCIVERKKNQNGGK